jgi:hypothetical protein
MSDLRVQGTSRPASAGAVLHRIVDDDHTAGGVVGDIGVTRRPRGDARAAATAAASAKSPEKTVTKRQRPLLGKPQ